MQAKDKAKKADKGEGPSLSDTRKQHLEAERVSLEKVSVFLIRHTLSAHPGLQMIVTPFLIVFSGCRCRPRINQQRLTRDVLKSMWLYMLQILARGRGLLFL